MAVCKRQENACTPVALSPPVAIDWTLPTELLLEIIARSDTRALVRGAAACKLLRQDILSPHFIRRVTQKGGIVPPCILAYVNIHHAKADPPPPLSLVFPNTPVTKSFLDEYLSPYMSRSAEDLLMEYYPVTSRGGLVLLHRRCRSSSTSSNLCVYDPITGHRTFLSYPPGINAENPGCFDCCILLTSADGIHCSFLLFFPCRITRGDTRTIEVHIATSTCVTWTPSAMSDDISYLLLLLWFVMRRDAVVIHGGVIHWLVRLHGVIVTFNACTMKYGTIGQYVVPITNFRGELHLGSHDGRKLLCLLGTKGFNISVWHQLPSRQWASEPVKIDVEEKLRSLYPDIRLGRPFLTLLQSAGMGSNIVLRHIYDSGTSYTRRHALLLFLDLDTMEMRVHQDSTPSILLEVDVPSRLRGMKIYS